MFFQFRESRLELLQGDITKLSVDAIVNAANCELAGGGGVDGAIHRAGGPSIMQETDRLYPQGCQTGSAVISTAGNLQARYVIHAVGPIWQGGLRKETEQLANTYQACLTLAVEHQCRSLAFPAISTGVYRFPLDLAAEVSLKTISHFLERHDGPLNVFMVLFDQGAFGAYARVLELLSGVS